LARCRATASSADPAASPSPLRSPRQASWPISTRPIRRAPALAKFLATCKAIDCLSASDLAAIGTARDALTALRPQAERDLALPLDQRSEAISDRWNKTTTALIDLLEKSSTACPPTSAWSIR